MLKPYCGTCSGSKLAAAEVVSPCLVAHLRPLCLRRWIPPRWVILFWIRNVETLDHPIPTITKQIQGVSRAQRIGGDVGGFIPPHCSMQKPLRLGECACSARNTCRSFTHKHSQVVSLSSAPPRLFFPFLQKRCQPRLFFPFLQKRCHGGVLVSRARPVL